MKNIIIDTDPGHDDAMALLFAIKSSAFHVKAITTVCGNSTIENTTRNARYILNLLGRDDIPIFSGEAKPIKRELIQAVVHGKSGLEGIDPTNNALLTNNAIDNILRIVDENPHEIILVTLGPLTNIAKAIKQRPDIMINVKEIVSMGGAIKVPGNKNRVAEFNFFVDPEAADTVFKFPVKKTIVPLDACNDVHMYFKDFKKVKNDKIREPLLKMVKPYISNIGKDIGIKTALMYDPLTIFYLLNPRSCREVQYNIQVETKGDLTRGMTVADLRNVTDGAENNCKVVEFIEADDFRDLFIEILNKE